MPRANAASQSYAMHARKRMTPLPLMPRIKQVWQQAKMQVYGADKVWHQLNREGVEVADSADPEQREFDALEIAQACEPDRNCNYDSAKKWLTGAKVSKYLDARRGQFEPFFWDRPTVRQPAGETQASLLPCVVCPGNLPIVASLQPGVSGIGSGCKRGHWRPSLRGQVAPRSPAGRNPSVQPTSCGLLP